MKLSEEKLTILINKMINVIKPKGVTDINFRLTPLGIRDDEYYMDIKYIVPDDSPYLTLKHRDIRLIWNNEIKKTIKGYFDVDVIINSTGMSSESYYNKQKEN